MPPQQQNPQRPRQPSGRTKALLASVARDVRELDGTPGHVRARCLMRGGCSLGRRSFAARKVAREEAEKVVRENEPTVVRHARVAVLMARKGRSSMAEIRSREEVYAEHVAIAREVVAGAAPRQGAVVDAGGLLGANEAAAAAAEREPRPPYKPPSTFGELPVGLAAAASTSPGRGSLLPFVSPGSGAKVGEGAHSNEGVLTPTDEPACADRHLTTRKGDSRVRAARPAVASLA
jgi:hypothetical protein